MRSMSDASPRSGGLGAFRSRRGCTNTNCVVLARRLQRDGAARGAATRNFGSHFGDMRIRMTIDQVEDDGQQHHFERGQRTADRLDGGSIILEIEIHQEVTSSIAGADWRLEAAMQKTGKSS